MEQSRSRVVCPKCGGGGSRERSFVTHGDWYKCYRASCGYSSGGKAPERTYAYEPPATRALDIHTLNILHSKWGILFDTAIAAGVRLVRPGRLYLPRYTFDGVLYGHDERNVEGPKKPYTALGIAPVGSWLVCDKKRVVLVEDALSAIRLWQEGLSVHCLCGTELHDLQSVQQFDEAVVCLDRDATHKAVRMARMLGNARAVHLEKDVKNMNEEELACLRDKWGL